jgi:hypothetical protein
VDDERGFIYWLEEASARSGRVFQTVKGDERIHGRRYVCADCVWNLFADLGSDR